MKEEETVQEHYGYPYKDSHKRIRAMIGALVAKDKVSDVLDSLSGFTDEQRVRIFEFAVAFSTFCEMKHDLEDGDAEDEGDEEEDEE